MIYTKFFYNYLLKIEEIAFFDNLFLNEGRGKLFLSVLYTKAYTMEQLILKYLQGKASENEKKKLLSWLREDTQNKNTFSQIRDIWLSTGDKMFDASYVHDAFLRFTREVKNIEKRQKRRSYSLYMRIAASVAILILCSIGGYWLGTQYNEDGKDDATIAIVNQVIMGKGNKGSVTLPDGTLVWLNENSKLVYPEQFMESHRNVRLIGEGYFEVTKNEEAPFVVETENMKIKVLGTCFNVRNYKEESVIEATLLSGKVNVVLPGHLKEITLQPNQTFFGDKRSGDFRVELSEAEERIIWINDKLIFSNEKLSTALRKMGYWYGINIVCDADLLMDQRVSFVIRKESKEEIFKLLSFIVPIEYAIDKNQVFIRNK